MDEEKVSLWKQRMTSFQSSGLSIKKWCRENHIAPPTFYYWRSRYLGHVHNWELLVPRKEWSKIKKIICEVMKNGKEYPCRSGRCKILNIKGHNVEVRFVRLSDGTIKISDAFVDLG